jgi:hypothetical protein
MMLMKLAFVNLLEVKTGSVLIVGFIVLVAALLLWFVIRWYIQPQTPQDRREAMTLLFQTLGGLAFLSGVFFTWQQLMTSRDQLVTAQQGQITERFTRAIDQLGKMDSVVAGASKENAGQNLAIRLGGIYALERIAKDSKTDHPVVMEVLTAFVRQTAPWSLDSETKSEDHLGIRPDTQAALAVIGRRTIVYSDRENQRLDLSGLDLRRATLTGARFQGVDLESTHFDEALLNNAELQGASLVDARFSKAVLRCANLQNANLSGADLKQSIVSGADFTNANLTGADFSGVNLSDVVGLTAQQLSSAKVDAQTVSPNNTGRQINCGHTTAVSK